MFVHPHCTPSPYSIIDPSRQYHVYRYLHNMRMVHYQFYVALSFVGRNSVGRRIPTFFFLFGFYDRSSPTRLGNAISHGWVGILQRERIWRWWGEGGSLRITTKTDIAPTWDLNPTAAPPPPRPYTCPWELQVMRALFGCWEFSDLVHDSITNIEDLTAYLNNIVILLLQIASGHVYYKY